MKKEVFACPNGNKSFWSLAKKISQNQIECTFLGREHSSQSNYAPINHLIPNIAAHAICLTLFSSKTDFQKLKNLCH